MPTQADRDIENRDYEGFGDFSPDTTTKASANRKAYGKNRRKHGVSAAADQSSGPLEAQDQEM